MKKTILNTVVTALFALSTYSVTFEWDHSPDPTVTGYRLYWGTNSSVYVFSKGVSKATNAITITNSSFIPDIPYFFTVTATNVVGIESLPSNVVCWTNIVQRPTQVSNFRLVN